LQFFEAKLAILRVRWLSLSSCWLTGYAFWGQIIPTSKQLEGSWKGHKLRLLPQGSSSM